MGIGGVGKEMRWFLHVGVFTMGADTVEAQDAASPFHR